MRALILCLLLLISNSSYAVGIDVHIIMGQSNAGGGAYPPVPPSYLNGQPVLYYPNLVTNQVWEANSPIELQTLWNLWPTYMGASYGSEISFAYQVSQFTENPVAIIKVAANGTGLETRWKPSLHDLYDWGLARVNVALSDLSQTYEPQVKSFIWIQGENDAGWDYWANKYEDNMVDFISALRNDLGEPNLPILINQLHKDSVPTAKNIVRQAQVELDALDNVYVSNNDDGILTEDGLHYTPEMHLNSGFRLANLLNPSADFNHDKTVDSLDLDIFTASYGVNRAGDANNDMVTDSQDFLIWQRQVANVQVFGVPEPNCVFLLSLIPFVWRFRHV